MYSKLISKTISIFSSLHFSPINSKPRDPPSNIEIRVCTNRTCRKQGSLQVIETLLGISPPHVSIKSCGCLGRCGSGPNLVLLPAAVFVSHCGTAARAADVMVHVCGAAGGDDHGLARRSLDALALRKKGEIEFQSQNFSEAEALFSQVIEAKPIGGIHIAYKARSAVRLALGNFTGALEDAREALISAPEYAEAYICQGDVFLAMDKLEDAEESYAFALETDPSLRRSKSFKDISHITVSLPLIFVTLALIPKSPKARVQRLQEKMTFVAMS